MDKEKLGSHGLSSDRETTAPKLSLCNIRFNREAGLLNIAKHGGRVITY